MDETGAMSWNFEVEDFYVEADSVGEELDNLTAEDESDVKTKVKKEKKKGSVGKYQVCKESLKDYIPCWDNEQEITRVDKYERHCPQKGLECLVRPPKGYEAPIPWPRSRDQVSY